ncbi:MAG: THUMP domain-containing class I SAM-dependent RNA methyltransferase [Flavobacteriales bacterium]|jgi:putative N6-adenine-specific DNA methylase|tara:strand:- start:40 stop:1197 length:1158 start_codon:yes stop_codon:yes gene_type:complete
MKEENYSMVATTMMGLEDILAEELRLLGAQHINVLNRAVEFVGDVGFMYKANLNLRTAIRILKPIFSFKARNEKELYRKIYEYDWEQHFDVDGTFAIQSSGFSEVFSHSKYTALKTKDAIADSFRDKHGKRPNVDVEAPDVQINVHVRDNSFVISLDSSGYSLHKRGYKVASVDAPINEVLAAALILLSDWNQISNFYDPMCGSATILVEAALIANNIPANIFRKRFGFSGWKDFDPELWNKIRDISLEKEKEYYGIISGADNFQKSLRAGRANINNALMRDDIEIKMQDFFDTKVAPGTHVVFNPPYGERMSIGINEFYQKIGDTLKHNYQGCTVWLISSDIENLKMIGLKPSRKIKVFNGKLECRFVRFDIYEGSKKESKQNR